MNNQPEEERNWYMKRIMTLLKRATVPDLRNIYIFTKSYLKDE